MATLRVAHDGRLGDRALGVDGSAEQLVGRRVLVGIPLLHLVFAKARELVEELELSRALNAVGEGLEGLLLQRLSEVGQGVAVREVLVLSLEVLWDLGAVELVGEVLREHRRTSSAREHPVGADGCLDARVAAGQVVQVLLLLLQEA